MNSEKQDKVQQLKVLAKGLLDTMIYIETAEQDRMIPISILCLFETALEKIYSLLGEVMNGNNFQKCRAT